MRNATFLKWGCAIAVAMAPAMLSPGFAQGNGNGGKPGAEAKGNKGQQGKPQGGAKKEGGQGGGQAMTPQKQPEIARGNGNGQGASGRGNDKKMPLLSRRVIRAAIAAMAI